MLMDRSCKEVGMLMRRGKFSGIATWTRGYVRIRKEKDRFAYQGHSERDPNVYRKKHGEKIKETGLSVSIVGRPNVGKSTLYNRLLDLKSARGAKAIVHKLPGCTRDVIYNEAVLFDLRFKLFDTAGLEEHLNMTTKRKRIESFFHDDSLAGRIAMDDSELYRTLYHDMALKTAMAVEKSDAALFVCDAREGLSHIDKQIAKWLLTVMNPLDIILVLNKYDSYFAERNYYDFYELGLGDPVPISASQGLGHGDLHVSLGAVLERNLLAQGKSLESLSPDYEIREEIEADAHDGDVEETSETLETSESWKALSPVSTRQRTSAVITADVQDRDVEETSKPLSPVSIRQKELGIALPSDQSETTAWKKARETEEREILVSIVGRPNVGKSTLTNKLTDKNVCLTGPAPGVTRDSVWVDHFWKGKPVKLVDTAGLKKRTNVESPLEEKSITTTIHAIRACHVCILVMDARDPWTQTEVRTAKLILDEGRCLLLAINKWDLIPKEDRAPFHENFARRTEALFPAVRKMKVVPISALHMKRNFDILDTACELYERWCGYLKTTDLNAWLREFKKLVPLPKRKGIKDKKKFNLLFVAQTNARPPTFSFYGASQAQVPDVYVRTLENGIRKQFDWAGIPIRLKFRPRQQADPSKQKDDGRIKSIVSRSKENQEQQSEPEPEAEE